LLGHLRPAILEKDIHVTDALAALAGIRVSHTAYRKDRRSQRDTRPAEVAVETRMIFAGGTCLAKAHGLIERMSEDIDIKVVLDEVPEGYALAGGRGDRSRLGELQVEVCERLKVWVLPSSKPRTKTIRAHATIVAITACILRIGRNSAAATLPCAPNLKSN
jgi:hypothetical protein